MHVLEEPEEEAEELAEAPEDVEAKAGLVDQGHHPPVIRRRGYVQPLDPMYLTTVTKHQLTNLESHGRSSVIMLEHYMGNVGFICCLGNSLACRP